MILTTTEAQEVADLITDITTSQYMLEDDNRPLRYQYLFMARKASATVELSDKFGIDLPTLDISRERLGHYRQRALDLLNEEA